jgi:hypothetical protein
MTSLCHELQRLYCLPDQACQLTPVSGLLQTAPLTDSLLAQAMASQADIALPLRDAQNHVRTLVLTLDRNRDWPHLAALYAELEQDFDLPLPALAVLADGGYQLWFSCAIPIPVAQGVAFLAGLRRQYLAQIPDHAVHGLPNSLDNDAHLALVPNWHTVSGRWSAFIDPSLGGMFAEEAGLDVPPNMEGQANILARFSTIKTAAFQRVLAQLQAAPAPAEHAATPAPAQVLPVPLGIDSPFADPKTFLLAVMNSPAASGELRVQAAAALLPYYEKPKA